MEIRVYLVKVQTFFMLELLVRFMISWVLIHSFYQSFIEITKLYNEVLGLLMETMHHTVAGIRTFRQNRAD